MMVKPFDITEMFTRITGAKQGCLVPDNTHSLSPTALLTAPLYVA